MVTLNPEVVEWRITGRCNERCQYCYGPKKIIDPSTSTVNEIATRLADSNVPVVRFSGGEPMLRNDFKDVCQRLHDAGKKVVLSTNGLRFRESRCWLDPLVTKVNFSLDGFDPRTHAQAGNRKPESFDTLIEGLRNLAEKPPCYPIKIGTVITAHNAFESDLLKKMYGLIVNFPITRWKIYQYIPEGPEANLELRVSDELFDHLQSELHAWLNSGKVQTSLMPIHFASAASRSAAYFIIQPMGEVFVPIGGSDGLVTESYIGNFLESPAQHLFESWAQLANIENHKKNLSLPLIER